MSNFNLKIHNKIAILEFDQPDSKVNVLSTASMQELAEIIGQLSKKNKDELNPVRESHRLESEAFSNGAKALLITSKKPGIFIAGADIKEIENINSQEEAIEKAEKGKIVLNALANLKIVTVAVINGACLGGGLELALSCKYRVAGFSDKIKIGLPEVKLGIIPGFGGTQRLPRLVGFTRGITMILAGEVISSRDALRYGLVDRLFPDARLIDNALDFVKGILEAKSPSTLLGAYEEQRAKSKKKREKPLQFFLEHTPVGREIVFSQAKKNVLKQTKGFYPAPLEALKLIKKTYSGDITKGFALESKSFGALAVTGVSKNLIKVFYLMEEFKKFPWVEPGVKPDVINKCGVLGAGIMGGGIAQLISFNNIPVRIKDISFDALKTALKTASSLYKYALKKRKLRKNDALYKMGLVSPTLTYKGFENSDLVIEAVVEDLGIKQKVFKELSGLVGQKTILASNTSSLSIAKMAEVTGRPENFIGLHFFNPVHRMPLVEIIPTEKTTGKTIATTIAFSRQLGKTVIVVKDVPGFLINRILLSYLNEAGFLAEDGLGIEEIDNIARLFGMPMGPIELIDEIGIDVGYKVAKILEEAYGERMRVSSLLGKAKENGLLGKKTKKGFYLYKGKKDEKKIPNPYFVNLATCCEKPIQRETALKRMIYVMINEASRCLEEGVVKRPHEVDIGMIMGTGFPPFRGGLLRYADSVGIANIVKDLRSFEEEFRAVRFAPCNYLADKAAKNVGFYGRSGDTLPVVV